MRRMKFPEILRYKRITESRTEDEKLEINKKKERVIQWNIRKNEKMDQNFDLARKLKTIRLIFRAYSTGK